MCCEKEKIVSVVTWSNLIFLKCVVAMIAENNDFFYLRMQKSFCSRKYELSRPFTRKGNPFLFQLWQWQKVTMPIAQFMSKLITKKPSLFICTIANCRILMYIYQRISSLLTRRWPNAQQMETIINVKWRWLYLTYSILCLQKCRDMLS